MGGRGVQRMASVRAPQRACVAAPSPGPPGTPRGVTAIPDGAMQRALGCGDRLVGQKCAAVRTAPSAPPPAQAQARTALVPVARGRAGSPAGPPPTTRTRPLPLLLVATSASCCATWGRAGRPLRPRRCCCTTALLLATLSPAHCCRLPLLPPLPSRGPGSRDRWWRSMPGLARGRLQANTLRTML